MPILRNFALHAFNFPRQGKNEQITFPAGVNAGDGKVKPSYTEIDDAALAELKEHDTAGDWFGPNGLVVEGTPRYPAGRADDVVPAEKFRPESSSPTMPWGSGPRPESFVETPVAPAPPVAPAAPVEAPVAAPAAPVEGEVK